MTRSSVKSPPCGLPSWDITLDLDSIPPCNPYLQDATCSNPNIKRDTDSRDPDSSTISTWLPQGPTKQGFVIHPDRPSEHLRSKVAPTIATHRGRLWMVWTDFDDQLWYSCTVPDGTSETFGRPLKFPYQEGNGKNGIPMITNLNGVLHAIIVSADTGAMTHYIKETDDDEGFIHQGPLPEGCVVAAAKESRGPALAAFHNKLFLAFINPDQRLSYTQWDADSQAWAPASSICTSTSPTKFQGKPAMFVLNGALHVLCEAAEPTTTTTTSSSSSDGDGAGVILTFKYGYRESGWTWDTTDDISEGRATRGVSGASYGGHAYLSFLNPAQGGAVYVTAHNADGKRKTGEQGGWDEPERVGGTSVKARFAPQVAVVNGRVHCVFSGRWRGDLRWFSRPVLGYDLTGWMGALDDGAWLSGLTIPGTHDSCARSNIPYVRTQYLSVTQQLAMGIRFLDLRLRRNDDGRLYCYHGGVPINMPKGLSFESVMDEVWEFIGPKEGGKRATETVLISINNDNRSKDQKTNPKPFYDAVKEAIDSTPAYEGDNGSGSRWYTAPLTARLGDVRGKAVLLRRYYGDPDVPPTQRMGLDLEEWEQDNPDFTIVTPSGVRVRLQDKWRYSRRSGLEELVASKMGHVRRMMELAAGTRADDDGGDAEGNALHSSSSEPEKTWFINFCSAVGEPVEHGEVAEAKWIAVGAHSNLHFFGRWIEGVNVRTRDYLRDLDEGAGRGGTRRLGLVNLDYPELPEDSDLVARLIETNF
ncbi:phosphatidylinositol phospholipase C [Diaporthe helianthi]|uniref:Phosphatidylinositol phospholipase C n=1 Tax=Diaporthe helianthi TaxID=158607 RepID=A0A2P5I9P0_DIAHE|nr:phosphatidylinositol phospholipase C [Diaporthe helianthi]